MSDFRIVVIQAGWVLAGEYVVDGSLVHLTQAVVVSRWGTERGLGQLALEGPTKQSQIFPCGEADVPMNAVLYTLKVTAEVARKWPR